MLKVLRQSSTLGRRLALLAQDGVLLTEPEMRGAGEPMGSCQLVQETYVFRVFFLGLLDGGGLSISGDLSIGGDLLLGVGAGGGRNEGREERRDA